MEVVVARAKSGQKQSQKEEYVRPTLARVEELRLRRFAQKKRKAHRAKTGERKVRRNVREIGNAQPRPPIGKVVVARRLRDAWNKEKSGEYQQGNRKEPVLYRVSRTPRCR